MYQHTFAVARRFLTPSVLAGVTALGMLVVSSVAQADPRGGPAALGFPDNQSAASSHHSVMDSVTAHPAAGAAHVNARSGVQSRRPRIHCRTGRRAREPEGVTARSSKRSTREEGRDAGA